MITPLSNLLSVLWSPSSSLLKHLYFSCPGIYPILCEWLLTCLYLLLHYKLYKDRNYFNFFTMSPLCLVECCFNLYFLFIVMLSIFLCPYWTFVFPSLWSICSTYLTILNWDGLSFYNRVVRVIYIFRIKVLSVMSVASIFFHLTCILIFLIVSFKKNF